MPRCAEGIGSRDFTQILLDHDDIEAFVARTYEPGFFIPDQWEVHELAKALRRAEVLCYTEGIDPDSIEAQFENGVLTVRIPKPQERKPRRVAISVGDKAPTIEGSGRQSSHEGQRSQGERSSAGSRS